MISCNNNNYVFKNYLNVFKIVPVEMESVQSFMDIAMLRYKLITTFRK